MTSAGESVAIVRRGSCRRSQILGTQVISQTNAARLGIIDQIWVDLTERQVIALGLLGSQRPVEPGTSLVIDLAQARAIGPDAILISEETLLDEYNPMAEGLLKVVGAEVVTETGVRLGKVKDFVFEIASGFVSELVLSNLGIPLLPGIVDSTYLLSSDDIIEVGPRRIITVEGAEARCISEVKSLLERFNIIKPSWDQREPIAALPPGTGRSALEEEEFETYYEQDYEDDYDEAYEEVYEDTYEPLEPEPEPIPAPRRRPSRSRRAVPPTPRPTPAEFEDDELDEPIEPPLKPAPRNQPPRVEQPAANPPVNPSTDPPNNPLDPLPKRTSLETPEDAWADEPLEPPSQPDLDRSHP